MCKRTKKPNSEIICDSSETKKTIPFFLANEMKFIYLFLENRGRIEKKYCFENVHIICSSPLQSIGIECFLNWLYHPVPSRLPLVSILPYLFV